jgi:hypothetical protein
VATEAAPFDLHLLLARLGDVTGKPFIEANTLHIVVRVRVVSEGVMIKCVCLYDIDAMRLHIGMRALHAEGDGTGAFPVELAIVPGSEEVYTIHCTLYTIHYTPYTTHCTLYTIPFILALQGGLTFILIDILTHALTFTFTVFPILFSPVLTSVGVACADLCPCCGYSKCPELPAAFS